MGTNNRIPFSVLIPVYYKENPVFLKRALKSIWKDQTLKPDEIVIVRDGPLTERLDQVIEQFAQKAPVKIVSLKKNAGLGKALAKGILACSHEFIARMDSDDISVPERFQKQLEYLWNNPEVDLLSSNIAEFSDNPKKIVSIRKVPSTHEEIVRFSRSRSPMNHMAVVFRKQAVLNAGNYKPFNSYEDYFLWVRMLMAGHQAANIDEELVLARTGNNMLARRQGYAYFKQELKLQKEFYLAHFIHYETYLRNIMLRAVPRLLPLFFLAIIYRYLRK